MTCSWFNVLKQMLFTRFIYIPYTYVEKDGVDKFGEVYNEVSQRDRRGEMY